MAFTNFPGVGVGDPPIQSLLNLGVGNFRIATGILPQLQPAHAFAEFDRRHLVEAHSLEQARIQEMEAARVLGMEQRVRMMMDSRAAAEQAFRTEPLPPGVDSFAENNGSGSFRDRREKERDREGRNRDRERDRSRDREKRRSDHDRDRWGDREGRDSGRHGRDHRPDRDRSPLRQTKSDDDEFNSQGDRSYDDERDRHRSRDSESRDGDKWVSTQPSRTIILRGLSHDVDSKMIGAELMVMGLPVKDIRLIRRASGVSRGFAFVEFHNAEDAKRWMDHTQGTLLLQNQYRAYMDYSISKERQGTRDLQKNDWVCYKCMAHNFKRRDYCYNCNLPRKESDKNKTPDGQEEIGTNPCNTIIFRGLDALTTEESLVTALNQALPTTLAPIKNIAIIRDEFNTSRGFGFVEFHSVAASTQMLDALNKIEPLLEVDGKQLLVNYAKNTFNTTMATMQQQSSQQYYDNYYQQQGGQYYDANTQQYYDYSQYYNQNSTTTSSNSSSTTATTATKGNSTNAAAAVAHAAIQQAQAVKNYQKQYTTPSTSRQQSSAAAETVTVNGVEYPIYPPPDTSSYQYDETSGYYYDPLTQLYYDANSTYYYNSTTGHYMYWDAEKSTYLPAPSTDDSGASDDKNKKEGKEKKDKEKVKMAKKIAKDMEKWAKSMNAQKEALKDGPKRFGAQGSFGGFQESATADAGFAMLTKAKEDKSLMPPPPLMGSSDSAKQSPSAGSKPGLVASYGGDSDSGDEEDSSAPVDESKLVDWAKLACLLCKRQFQSKEILNKHTQFSDLHKQNLEQLNLSRSASAADKIEYRDRAKERRQKYGAPEPPAPRKRKGRDFESGDAETSAPVPYEEPTKFGIGGDNIGNKLLQKMGWSHGQGLGKANQGRTELVQAERRNQSAGLGVKGGKVVADVGDSYRDALKKTMYARYNEME